MAGDLMSGTCTYTELQKKYGNFFAPAIKISVGGKDLGGMGLAFDDVSVDIPLTEAGSCTFTVVNAYDIGKRQFDSDAKSVLIPGKIVEVQLGYVSALTKVFKGYISEVSASFRDAPTLTITAMDVRKLMMESGETYLVHKVTSYSAAFNKVMARYDKIASEKEVDSTDEEAFTDITQRKNDYDFITKQLCRAGNREFLVVGGKAYFRKPEKVASNLMTLEWGRDLISFSRSSMYQDIKVTVIGYDEENKEPVVGEAAETNDGNQTQVISETQKTIHPRPGVSDAKTAKAKAEKEALERKRSMQTGNAGCIGLPEIVPGRFIKIDKLDSQLNSSYYIRKVTHSFGSDGFTTNFEIRGWK